MNHSYSSLTAASTARLRRKRATILLSALLLSASLCAAAFATPKAPARRHRQGRIHVVTKLPTKAIRGRIAKPQVVIFFSRRAPVFRPWIASNTLVYGHKNTPRRPLFR